MECELAPSSTLKCGGGWVLGWWWRPSWVCLLMPSPPANSCSVGPVTWTTVTLQCGHRASPMQVWVLAVGSTLNLQVPSFVFTRLAGVTQGISDGSITPAAAISSIICFVALLTGRVEEVEAVRVAHSANLVKDFDWGYGRLARWQSVVRGQGSNPGDSTWGHHMYCLQSRNAPLDI